MTEDEAKTKICHRSIDGDDSPAPVIGNEMFAKKFACIGSACMAWRWLHPAQPNRSATADAIPMVDHEGNPARGFCGLAGKP